MLSSAIASIFAHFRCSFNVTQLTNQPHKEHQKKLPSEENFKHKNNFEAFVNIWKIYESEKKTRRRIQLTIATHLFFAGLIHRSPMSSSSTRSSTRSHFSRRLRKCIRDHRAGNSMGKNCNH